MGESGGELGRCRFDIFLHLSRFLRLMRLAPLVVVGGERAQKAATWRRCPMVTQLTCVAPTFSAHLETYASSIRRPAMGSVSKGPLFLTLLITLLSVLFANAQEPESKITYFANLPAGLFFFDDTSASL